MHILVVSFKDVSLAGCLGILRCEQMASDSSLIIYICFMFHTNMYARVGLEKEIRGFSNFTINDSSMMNGLKGPLQNGLC